MSSETKKPFDNNHISKEHQDEFNKQFKELLEQEDVLDDFESLVVDLSSNNVSDEELINLAKEQNGFDFGNYEVVYNTETKPQEVFANLNENVKMGDFEHDDDQQIVENAKTLASFENERQELANFYQHNNEQIDISNVRGLIEASIYVLGNDGINLYDLRKVVNLPVAIIKSILEEMQSYYSKNKNSGLLLVQYGNKYKFVTKAEYNQQIGLIINKTTKKPLSESAIETLSIIAYNQPCTKSTIEKIRNKDCTNAIQRLLEIGLIETDGRSDAIGKPWLYSVSQKFFDIYGIKSLSELPPIDRQSKVYTDNAKEQEIENFDE